LTLFLHAVFEEPEDPSNRSFFSEIISSISDVKFSHNGRYMITRDYLSVKVWDLQMDTKPIETYQVHEYLRSKLCALYENDCIFDKFECSWSGNDRYVYSLWRTTIVVVSVKTSVFSSKEAVFLFCLFINLILKHGELIRLVRLLFSESWTMN